MVLQDITNAHVPLERDAFLRTLLRHLTGALQDVAGLGEASGFVSVVGQKIGEEINEAYKSALALSHPSRKQVAVVLVDLKRRIQMQTYWHCPPHRPLEEIWF